MNSQRITAALLLVMGLAVSGSVWSAQAGLVQFVSGDVEVTTAAGVTHAVHKGDPINEGDTITSAKAASAQIKMQDGGFIAVRPDTQLKFDSFKFSGKEGEPESSFFSLTKGGFRAVTGLVGRVRKEDYHITTPAATIGIRGTDHETVMVLPDNPLVAAGQAAPGAYNKVNVGETSITTEKGTINVLPNQMGFAGGRNEVPQIKPINTGLFTVAPQASSGAKMNSGKGGDAGVRAATVATASMDTTTQTATGGNNTAGSNNTAAATTTTAATTTSAATTSVASVSTIPTVVPPTVVIDPVTVILGPANVPTAAYVDTSTIWGIATPTFTTGNGWGLANSGKNSSSISSLPNPTSFSTSYSCGGGGGGNCATSFSLTLSGTPTASANSSNATTGIQWGYWQSGTPGNALETVVGGSTPFTNLSASSNPAITWIAGPAANWMLPMILSGTVTYSLVGSGVTTNGLALGTVSNAGLSVNFSAQTVSLTSLILSSLGGSVWSANALGTSNAATLGSGSGNAGFQFNTTGLCTGCNGQGTLTLTETGTGSGGTLSGTVNGSLTGNGLTGALLNFDFSSAGSGAQNMNAAGVAALGLSSGTINTAAPYQVLLSSVPQTPTSMGLGTSYPNNSNPYVIVQDTVGGAAFNPAGLSINASGGSIPQINSNMLDALASGGITGPASASITGSTAVNTGTDSVSGISWGRWSGGSVTYTALNGSGTFTQAVPAGGFNWIKLPASSGSNSLPISGTFNYILAGGTQPTDQLGNVGTVNSATLQANFSAGTVNIAANVSMPADNVTFNGNATGVPITNGMIFQTKNNTFGTVTCAGSGCGAVTAGNAVGAFTQGGVGAALSYGFQTGPSTGNPSIAVGGVVAFHR